jgi:nitrogen regulatory protein P-II 1
MKLITVITTPATFDTVKDALALFGVRGMTVGQVLCVVDEPASVQIYRGSRYISDLRPCLKIELVVSNDEWRDVVRVIATILTSCDPKESSLWNTPVEILARVRTGEFGIDAL